MKSLLLAGALVLSGSAMAQAQVDVRLELPQIHFEVAPPLVEVSPGVQVVENYDDEIFFNQGYYWVRRPHGWFRSRDWRGNWAVVEPRYVPRYLVRAPPGRYRHWHREERRDDRRDDRRLEHVERRMDRDERKMEHGRVEQVRHLEREERREDRRDDRRDERHDDHGHNGHHGH